MAKSKQTPKIANYESLEELQEILSSSGVLKYVMASEEGKVFELTPTLIKSKEGNALLLMDDDWAKKILKNVDNLFGDATFGIVPRNCGYQLLTIMGEHYEQVTSITLN